VVRACSVPPRLEGAVELLDSASISETEIRESLRDLERLNRRFGGARTILLNLERLTGGRPETKLTILDIATGGGDIPRAICRWARRRRLPVAIEAVDRNELILSAAREWSGNYPEIRFEKAEGPLLQYQDRSFDYAISSLFLHHLTRAEAVSLLREMGRIARKGLIANDLRRSRTAWILTRIATRLFSSNRLTLHDGPMSVARSFRPEELLLMAKEAGLTDAKIHLHPWFRMALVTGMNGQRI
jgi:ubiquinone/menaquinone biosynthesis C-methylase UbiE